MRVTERIMERRRGRVVKRVRERDIERVNGSKKMEERKLRFVFSLLEEKERKKIM
jgi:hypothetical protein